MRLFWEILVIVMVCLFYYHAGYRAREAEAFSYCDKMELVTLKGVAFDCYQQD